MIAWLIFAAEDFAFDVVQQFAGQAVWKAFRGRHTLEDAVDKQLDSFTVKLMGNVAKLLNSPLKADFDGCGPMMPKALAKRGAEVGKMASKRSIVIAGALLERCQ